MLKSSLLTPIARLPLCHTALTGEPHGAGGAGMVCSGRGLWLGAAKGLGTTVKPPPKSGGFNI